MFAILPKVNTTNNKWQRLCIQVCVTLKLHWLPDWTSAVNNDTIPTVVDYMRLAILCRSSLSIHDLLSTNALLAQNLFFKNGNLETDFSL